LDEGVVVYPCAGGVDGESGDFLLLMPPFVTGAGDLELMAERTGRAIARLSRDLE
jgi:adenosylmethionine-8-amino-7-oxononanoate aminotransferase